MNPYLRDIPEDADESSLPLLAHRLGDRCLEELAHEAYGDPSDWPAEWKTYERKAYPRFDERRVPLGPPFGDSGRRSTRVFGGGEVSIDQLSHILGGIRLIRHGGSVHRDCPSAGGLFPVECYVVAAQGALAEYVSYYDAEAHELVQTLKTGSRLLEDSTRSLGTSQLARPSLLVVLTGVMYRTMRKYGARGYRYALLEAGAMAHEIDRRVQELGLESCWLGGFDDEVVADLVGCRPALDMELPLILLAVGHPAEGFHERCL